MVRLAPTLSLGFAGLRAGGRAFLVVPATEPATVLPAAVVSVQLDTLTLSGIHRSGLPADLELSLGTALQVVSANRRVTDARLSEGPYEPVGLVVLERSTPSARSYQGTERRTHPRVVTAGVGVRVMYDEDGRLRATAGKLRDLSAGGCSVGIRRALPIGIDLRIRLSPRQGWPALDLRGQVVRLVPDGDGWKVGMRFMGLADGVREMLARLVFEQRWQPVSDAHLERDIPSPALQVLTE